MQFIDKPPPLPPPLLPLHFPRSHSANVLVICAITSYGLKLKYPCRADGEPARDNWPLCGRAPAAIPLDGCHGEDLL